MVTTTSNLQKLEVKCGDSVLFLNSIGARYVLNADMKELLRSKPNAHVSEARIGNSKEMGHVLTLTVSSDVGKAYVRHFLNNREFRQMFVHSPAA